MRTYDGKFCCLGVLCDLRDRQLKRTQWLPNNGYQKRYQDAVLPVSVKRWAGLDENDPLLDLVGMRLSGLNDNVKPRYTFKRIADLIEKHL